MDDNIQIDIIVNLQGLESVNALNRALGGTTGAVDKTTKSIRANTDANYRGIKSWGELSGHLSRVEMKLDAVWRAGVHLKALGNDLIRVSKGIISPLQDATNLWGDFEFSLNRAAAAMDIFDNQSALYGKLKDAIYAAAREARLFPAQDIAKATYYWQSTTGEAIKTEAQLLRAVSNVTEAMKVASLTETGYETVLKGAYSISRQFGLGLSDIPNILHMLYVETQRTALEFPDLIQSFKYVGPLAKALHIPFTDVAKLLGVLGDMAQRGSMSGRGFAMLLTSLVAPTKKARGAFDDLFKSELGVKDGFSKLIFPKGKFVGMTKLIMTLAKATAGLTDEERNRFVADVTTQNGMRILLPLLNKQIELLKTGKSVFDEEKYSLIGAGKAFDQAFGLLSKSWKGTLGYLQETVEPIILMVGERIAKALTPFVEKAADALLVVQKWVKENPGLVDIAVTLLAIVAGGLAVVGVVFSILGSLILLGAGIAYVITGFGGIILAFSVLGGIVAAMVAAVVSNTAGIRDALSQLGTEIGHLLAPAEAGIKSFGVTLGDLPKLIGPAAVAAITAIADGIRWLTAMLKKLDEDPATRNAFRTIAEGLGIVVGLLIALRTASAVLGLVTGGFWALGRAMDFVVGVTKALSGISTLFALFRTFGVVLLGIAVALGPIGLLIVGVIAAIAAAVVAYETNFMGFRDFVNGIVTWLVNNVLPAVTSFVNNVLGIINGIATALTPIVTVLWAPFDKLINVGIPALIKILQDLAAAWLPVFQNIAAVVVDVFTNQIIPAIGPFLDVIQQHLMPLLGELWTWFTVVWNGIIVVVGTVLGLLVKAISDFLIWVAPYVNGVLEFLVRVFGNSFAGILQIVSSILGTVMDVIRGAMETIRGVIGVVMSLIKGDWSGAWDGIKGVIGSVWGIIESLVRGAIGVVEGVISVGLGVISAIFETVFGLKAGSIYQKIVGFLNTALKFGGDVITNISNGVSNAISWAINTIGGFIGSIIASVGDFITGRRSGGGGGGVFGDLIAIGKHIVEGIWEGIKSMFNWMVDRIKGFIADAIPGPIKDFLGIHSPSRMMAEIGVNIVKGLADGIMSSDAAVAAMRQQTDSLASTAFAGADRINMALEAQLGAGTGVSLSSSNIKVVKLEVEVTSPDGSVSQLDTQQLADLIKGPDLVAALEHMASVD